MDPCEIFAEVIEGDSVGGGIAASGTECNASGAGEGLTVAGEGDPEAAAKIFGGPGADDEGQGAVVVVEKGGVDGVERVLGVEENFA